MESLKDLITTIEDTITKQNRNKSVMAAYNKKPGTASKQIPFTRKKIGQKIGDRPE